MNPTLPELSVVVAERRRCRRAPASYPVRVCHARGRILARGRTTNISEDGVHVLVSARDALETGRELVLEIDVPLSAERRVRRDRTRTVRYRSRVIWTEEIGPMVGAGMQFIEKLR